MRKKKKKRKKNMGGKITICLGAKAARFPVGMFRKMLPMFGYVTFN